MKRAYNVSPFLSLKKNVNLLSLSFCYENVTATDKLMKRTYIVSPFLSLKKKRQFTFFVLLLYYTYDRINSCVIHRASNMVLAC